MKIAIGSPKVEGFAAHDDPVSGNPVLIAGRATGGAGAVATGDVSYVWLDLRGKVVISGTSNNGLSANERVFVVGAGNADGATVEAIGLLTDSQLRGFAPDGASDRLRTVGDSAPGLGQLSASPASPGSSDTKTIVVDVAATSATRQTLLTPTVGKKLRIVTVEVVTRGLTTNPDRVGVYFGTGAAYMTTVANAVAEFVPGTTGKGEMNFPDGGGPVGAVDAVLSGITETETETALRYTITYREE